MLGTPKPLSPCCVPGTLLSFGITLWGNRGLERVKCHLPGEGTESWQPGQTPELEKLSLAMAVGRLWSWVMGRWQSGHRTGHGPGEMEFCTSLSLPQCCICPFLPFSDCSFPASVPRVRQFTGFRLGSHYRRVPGHAHLWLLPCQLHLWPGPLEPLSSWQSLPSAIGEPQGCPTLPEPPMAHVSRSRWRG